MISLWLSCLCLWDILLPDLVLLRRQYCTTRNTAVTLGWLTLVVKKQFVASVDTTWCFRRQLHAPSLWFPPLSPEYMVFLLPLTYLSVWRTTQTHTPRCGYCGLWWVVYLYNSLTHVVRLYLATWLRDVCDVVVTWSTCRATLFRFNNANFISDSWITTFWIHFILDCNNDSNVRRYFYSGNTRGNIKHVKVGKVSPRASACRVGHLPPCFCDRGAYNHIH